MSKPLELQSASDVAISRPGAGIIFASSSNVPTTGTPGYSLGCFFLKDNGATEATVWYYNSGTLASCTFTPVDLNITENAYLSGTVPGTAAASKAVVLDASKGIATITTATISTLTTDAVVESTATNGITLDSVRLKDGIVFTPVTVGSTTSATPTITAANMAGGVIVATTQSTSTVTMDTGTALETYFTSIVGTVGFFWSIVNSNSGTMTITNNISGNNLTGLNTLATLTSARFFTYRVSANSWATVRVS